MTKKQKTMLARIIAAFLIYIPLFAASHKGAMEGLSAPVNFAVFLVPYLVIGWDIVYKAVRGIVNGQVFDENFLMTIATFGAFGVGEYSEAVAVMLFYQVGELFQSYAVSRSRQSIADLMDICPEYANLEKDGELVQTDPDDVEIGDIIVIKPGEPGSFRRNSYFRRVHGGYLGSDWRVCAQKSGDRLRDYQRLHQ